MIAYVINLDGDSERLALISAALGAQGISWERVPAIYGSSLDEQQLTRHRAAGVVDLTPNEIGCLLSHQRAIDRFLESGAPQALFLEDDMRVAPSAAEALACIEDNMAGYSVLKLEATPMGIDVARRYFRSGRRRLHALRTHNLGTGAYVLDRMAGQVLRDALEKAVEPVDLLLFRTLLHDLPMAQMIPSPFIQDQFCKDSRFPSTIGVRGTTMRDTRRIIDRIRPILVVGLNILRYPMGLRRVTTPFG